MLMPIISGSFANLCDFSRMLYGHIELDQIRPLPNSNQAIEGRKGPVASQESYQDLADHLAIFLRKAKRRAESPSGG